MSNGKVLIAQGGGPTAVINESLVGAVLQSRGHDAVEAVYGAFHGVQGIVNEDFIDLTREPDENLERVAKTPCSALGSTRDKPDQKYCQDIFKVLQAHGIGTFFYIGGNDSSDTLRILAEEAANADHPEQAILDLKIVDPAAGSGHFLIAAANRIADRLARIRADGDERKATRLRRCESALRIVRRTTRLLLAASIGCDADKAHLATTPQLQALCDRLDHADGVDFERGVIVERQVR